MMRVWWLGVLCALGLLAGCAGVEAGVEGDGVRLDEAATAAAPWRAGEVVLRWRLERSEAEALQAQPGEEVEERFVGMTADGGFVLQQFYAASGKKLTGPYVTRLREDVGRGASGQEGVEGMLSVWYATGVQCMQSEFKAGRRVSLVRWSPQGAMQERWQMGEDGGLLGLQAWYANGQLKRELVSEVDAGGAVVQHVREWDEEGRLLDERRVPR